MHKFLHVTFPILLSFSLNVYGFFQTVFYFGYMALVSIVLGILCGNMCAAENIIAPQKHDCFVCIYTFVYLLGPITTHCKFWNEDTSWRYHTSAQLRVTMKAVKETRNEDDYNWSRHSNLKSHSQAVYTLPVLATLVFVSYLTYSMIDKAGSRR